MSKDALGMEGEKAYYAQRLSLTGAQYGALAATPLYALVALRRGAFSIRTLVRYNWTVPLLGAAGGYGTALAVTLQEPSAATAARTHELRRDASIVRKDDMFLVGSAIGALLTPALFLGRAGLINGVLGGAGIGGASGLATFFVQHEGADDILDRARDAAAGAEAKGKQIAHDVTANKS